VKSYNGFNKEIQFIINLILRDEIKKLSKQKKKTIKKIKIKLDKKKKMEDEIATKNQLEKSPKK
jgi:hypothetical protein